ncbi:MAG TPA: hypothetical protein VK141_06180, partial [Nitrosomonas sp.]|nr:hypothetical protein [Nitrosomonas sp.]
ADDLVGIGRLPRDGILAGADENRRAVFQTRGLQNPFQCRPDTSFGGGGARCMGDRTVCTEISGNYITATATYTGLPAENSAFKLKECRVKYDDNEAPVAEDNFEAFFMRDQENHPELGPHPGSRSKNWFYYWNQTAAGYPQASWNSIVGTWIGWAPAMKDWSLSMTWTKTQILIYTGANGSYTRRDRSLEVASGIDMFANVVLHELHHNKQIADEDSLLGSLNGKAGTVWSKDWRWNTGARNHWTLGVDGKAGKDNKNDDGDSTIDEKSDMSEVRSIGSDDVPLDADNNDWPDSWAIAPGLDGPIEEDAQKYETNVEDTHARKDWGIRERIIKP